MARQPASGKTKRGKGCGIAFLVFLALAFAAGLLVGHFVGEAKRTEQTLNERCGEATAFVPAPDGSIAAGRVEAFLRVREQVREHCAIFQEKLGVLARLDQLGQDENLPGTVVARESFDGLKGMLSLGPAFLRFMEARNQALLEEEMGLGEYLYIYVLAYADQLRQVHNSPFADSEQAYVGDRARRELAEILQNQLSALESSEVRAAHPELAADLRDQIDGLGAGRRDLPWANGLPPTVEASLEPYAELLAELHCAGIAKIELMQKNKGLDVQN